MARYKSILRVALIVTVTLSAYTSLEAVLDYHNSLRWLVCATFNVSVIILLVIIFRINRFSHFETSYQNIKLVLNDDGKLCRYRSITDFRVLKNGIDTQTHIYRCDGTIDNFQIKPSIIKNETRDGDQVNIETQLERVFNKGDQFQTEVSFNMINSFTGEREYWITQKMIDEANLILTVIFPSERDFKSHVVKRMRRGLWVNSNRQGQRIKTDSRPALELRLSNLKVGEQYKIEWIW